MCRLFLHRFRKRRRESGIDIGAWCRIQAQFRWKFPDGDMPCRFVFDGEMEYECELDPEWNDQCLGKWHFLYDWKSQSSHSADIHDPNFAVDVAAGRLGSICRHEVRIKKKGQTCHFPLSQEKKGNDTSGPFFCSYFASRTRRNPALLFLKFGGIAKRLETRISMAVRSQEPPRRTLLSPLLFTGSLTAFFL